MTNLSKRLFVFVFLCTPLTFFAMDQRPKPKTLHFGSPQINLSLADLPDKALKPILFMFAAHHPIKTIYTLLVSCKKAHPKKIPLIQNIFDTMKYFGKHSIHVIRSKRRPYMISPYAFKTIPPELSSLFEPFEHKNLLELGIIAENTQMLAFLLDQGLLINGCHGQDQNTLLHLAALKNAPRTAQYLLDRSALPNAHNGRNQTPLDLAMNEGFFIRKAVYQVLHDAGCKKSSKKLHDPLRLPPHVILRCSYSQEQLKQLQPKK